LHESFVSLFTQLDGTKQTASNRFFNECCRKQLAELRMKFSGFLTIWLAIAFAMPSFVFAQSLEIQRVASGLSNPLFVTFAPGDSSRLYIVQRAGAIRILNLTTGTLNSSNFMSVPDVSSGSGNDERGLLGLAFHPDFQTNNFFYVYHTDTSGDDTKIVRYTATSADTGNPASGMLLLEIDQPQTNHNGGWIGFGTDGYLYAAVGDGGGANDSGTGHTSGTGNAQDTTNNLLGKMLRIDVNGDDFPGDATRNYRIPPTNPFVGVTGDDEIYIWGLRNPWRCSFDRMNGNLYIADVGQNNREEIDVLPGGGNGGENLGWRLREGTIQTPTVGGPQPPGGINPIYDYSHTGGNFGGFSVTGGYVYRGPVLGLRGNYFFADFVSNNVWSLRYDGSDPSTFNGTNFTQLIRWNSIWMVDAGTISSVSSFGEDLDGNLYIVDFGGEIFKIVGGNLSLPGTLDDVVAIIGTYESGTIANLNQSDNMVLEYRNVHAAPDEASLQLEFHGTVGSPDPSVLIFEFESRVNTLNLTQTTEIFNFMTGAYELFDTRAASSTDQAYSVELKNAADYANENGDVRARVTLSANGPVVMSPWAIIMDQAGWEYVE
jgi:glucose/arabinose dehydrogenase